MHLLLPLTASVIFVFGLMLVKKANSYGVNPWTVTFCANMLAFVLFANYLWLGSVTPEVWEAGNDPPDAARILAMIWQPALIACLYIIGQVFTFTAISVGDVSLATPVFSVKVIIVALLVTMVAGEQLTLLVWGCAMMAAVGIVMVQFSGRAGGGRVGGSRIGLTIGCALLAACSFAMHDVSVQRFAPHWPMSLFLPLVFGIAAVLSLGFLPFIDNPFKLKRDARLVLLGGAFCIAFQALCLVSSMSLFGDAVRVNIVYSLRGLWGVVLVFLLAKQFGSHEATVSRSVMVMRIAGAVLLTAAAILAISERQL